MEKLDKILELWSVDSEMDKTQPGNELINISRLHHKYLTILVKHKVASKTAHFKYISMRKTRGEWYMGKLSQDDLELNCWEPSPLKILKTELNTYLDADEILITMLQRKSYHDECVSIVDSIMAQIKNRNWELRSFIDWTKFQSGN